MQMLTGHGIFNSYRKRIGKEVDTKCWDCGDRNDDVEHVLFVCPKWIDRRIELENFLGVKISVDNLVGTAVTKDEYWRKFREFCKDIMNYRREMEKAMESTNRRNGISTQR
ncbi:uncharacterized protein LOC143303766 [Bombus vancouverensis nearcticus]|uniref:uncharacterized protein LOC143303766 n=1 Tax=Bombus vancouverensis nearcticus TaxID=2705178 RepID=UPI00402B2ECE